MAACNKKMFSTGLNNVYHYLLAIFTMPTM